MGKNPQTKGVLKREFSSGGVVHDFEKDLWLLIRTKNIKTKKAERWQLPKGHIEKGESSEIAAVREVQEESGIKAEIMRKLGTNKIFFFWEGERIFKTITFFLMKYVSGDVTNHNEEVEEAIFVPFEEALEKLSFKDDKATLTKAKEFAEQGTQGDLL